MAGMPDARRRCYSRNVYTIDDAQETISRHLAGMGTTRAIAAGEFLYHEGTDADDMCLVESGTLEVLIGGNGGVTAEAPASLGTVGPGAVIGEIGAILGGVRTASVRAREATVVRVIGRGALDEAMARQRELTAAIEAIVHHRLQRNRHVAAVRSFLGSASADIVEAILERSHPVALDRGAYLFRAGDPGESLYLLVSGVLEVVTGDDSDAGADSDATSARVIAQIHRGEPVGEMALISDEVRSASVRSVRSCDLLRLARADFERLIPLFPDILMGVTRTLVERIRQRGRSGAHPPRRGRQIAVVPTGRADRTLSGTEHTVQSIVTNLYDAMPPGVSAYILTSDHIERTFGRADTAHAPATTPRGLALSAWIEELEASYDLLFLVADASAGSGSPVAAASPESPDAVESSGAVEAAGPAGPTGDDANDVSGWTHRCLAQADTILVVADEATSERPAGLEAAVYAMGEVTGTAAVDLVVVHPADTAIPRGTATLLRHRPIRAHYHIDCDRAADYARVARSLTARAVGVALGGGGARGVSHVGVLSALADANVPIDAIAGTSMGAVVGALWAMGHRRETMLAQIEEMFVRRRPFREFTWPRYALLGGNRSRRAAIETFGELTIEDLWIPFVCTSSNLSVQELGVHRTGSLARAILATTAVPGVVVPQPIHGDVHVDGGVLNNLPADLLPSSCARVVVCDVDPAPELLMVGERFPSPWKRVRRARHASRDGADQPDPPTIGTILYASMIVASQAHARAVRERADVVIQPDVSEYGLLSFEEYRTICARGHERARDALAMRPQDWWEST